MKPFKVLPLTMCLLLLLSGALIRSALLVTCAQSVSTSFPAIKRNASDAAAQLPTPTPTPDPLAFTAAEQGEVRTILADQKQIGERLRQLDAELANVKEDDEKGFALVGLKRQRQLEKLRASEDQGAKFIEKVKPRCADCVFDFDKMRLVKPPNAETAINSSSSTTHPVK